MNGNFPDAPKAKPASDAETSRIVRSMIDQKSASKRQRIGEQLIEAGIITQDQLNVALREKLKTGLQTGEQLVKLGFVSSSYLQSFLSESEGVEQFDPNRMMVDPETVATPPFVDCFDGLAVG